MVLSLALLQGAFGVASTGAGVSLGVLVSLGFAIATGLPGQAFLKRWRVAGIAYGSQVVMILAASAVLAGWQ